jgi:hypothetical protein
MEIRSRQKKAEIITTKTGEKITKCYCRKCMQEKNIKNFYNAVDTFLDSNGKFSICRQCISDIYDGIYAVEKSVEKTIYRMCRMLNVYYAEEAIEMVRKHGNSFADKGYEAPVFFGLYLSKLATIGKTNGITEFTFVENVNISSCESDDEIFEEDDDLERIRNFWGRNFDADDLQRLEFKYAEWSDSHTIGSQNERMLLKLICLKELTLEKAMLGGTNSTGKLEKEYQDLLKTAALAPIQTTESSSGKGHETWGSFVKMIEETEPAEFYKDKKLFSDVDNIDSYLQKFLIRPLKNFVLGARDFNINDDEMDEYEDLNDEVEDVIDGDESTSLSE